MENKEVTSADIANALINLSENAGFCDKDTATGFRASKKKEMLKSNKEYSFSKFTSEIEKRQENKD